MKKNIIAATLLFALILGIALNIRTYYFAPVEASAYCISGQGSINKALIVTGTGVVKAKPDFASISLSIETRSSNLEDAQRENTKIVENLIKMLKEQNINKQDITTNWFNIYPEYDYSLGQRLLGHRVSNQLSVKVRDIASVGKIIDLSIAAGANIISGVQFGVEDGSAAYNKAMVKAVETAIQKAVVLSKAAGFEDVKIVFVKETSVNYFGFGRHCYAGSYADSGHTIIMNNDIDITASVEIVFEKI
ncbi:MAG: SIMPL domain-containing protein [Firmicutes bacterium]|nr:SIMPL domain-containing protein [Bacillota bacterium]